MDVTIVDKGMCQLQVSWTLTWSSSTIDGRPSGDLIPRILGSAYFRLGFFPVDYLLGFVRLGGYTQDSYTLNLQYGDPEAMSYHGGRDVTLFSNAPSEAINHLWGPLSPSVVGENSVRHVKLIGSALLGSSTPLNVRDHTGSILGYTVDQMNNNVRLYRQFVISAGSEGLVYSPKLQGQSGVANITDASETMARLSHLCPLYWEGGLGNRYHQITVHRITITQDVYGPLFNYDITCRNWPQGHDKSLETWRQKSYSVTLRARSYYKSGYQGSNGFPRAGTFGLQSAAYGVRIEETSVCTENSGPGEFSLPNVGNVKITTTEVPTSSFSSALHTGVITNTAIEADHDIRDFPYDMHHSGPSYVGRYQLQRLHEKFASIEKDLCASAFYSTAEAITGHLDNFKSNNLEALLELGDALRVLNLIKDFRDLVKAIKRVGIDQARREFVDLITDFELLRAYGIEPTKKLAEEITTYAQRIEQGRDAMSESSQPVTLYGEFKYDLPEGLFGYRKARLVTHSKVTVGFSNNNLARLWLGLKDVGLEPSTSQLWDTLPFSFVVDWFSNMDDRLEAFDNQALMLSCRCYGAVHSIKVYIDIDRETLTAWNLSPLPNVEAETPVIVYYRRYVSRRLPVLRWSQFDYLGVNGVPNLVTAGSLAWQVIAR